MEAVKDGVDDVREERGGEDDNEGVDVVEEVVGGAVSGHGGALASGDGADAAVVEVVEGEEEDEHLAGGDGAAGYVYLLVGPGYVTGRWLGRGWLCEVPEVTGPEFAFAAAECEEDDLEESGELGLSPGCWCSGDAVAEEEQEEREGQVDGAGGEECQPEAYLLCGEGHGNPEESPNVDQAVAD